MVTPPCQCGLGPYQDQHSRTEENEHPKQNTDCQRTTPQSEDIDIRFQLEHLPYHFLGFHSGVMRYRNDAPMR